MEDAVGRYHIVECLGTPQCVHIALHIREIAHHVCADAPVSVHIVRGHSSHACFLIINVARCHSIFREAGIHRCVEEHLAEFVAVL